MYNRREVEYKNVLSRIPDETVKSFLANYCVYDTHQTSNLGQSLRVLEFAIRFNLSELVLHLLEEVGVLKRAQSNIDKIHDKNNSLYYRYVDGAKLEDKLLYEEVVHDPLWKEYWYRKNNGWHVVHIYRKFTHDQLCRDVKMGMALGDNATKKGVNLQQLLTLTKGDLRRIADVFEDPASALWWSNRPGDVIRYKRMWRAVAKLEMWWLDKMYSPGSKTVNKLVENYNTMWNFFV